MKDDIKDHLYKLKEHEPDLYEEIELEELQESLQTNRAPKQTKEFPKKAMIILISIFMLGSVVGTLGAVLNIPAIHFLKTSYTLSQSETIQQYKQAVVTVKVDDSKGTGFSISDDGVIITNFHVIEGQDQAQISLDDGRAFLATVCQTLPELDIAVLTVETDEAIPSLPIAREKIWESGDHVYVIGNPLAFNRIVNEGTIVAISEQTGLQEPVLLIDAPVYKGNSGSPVIHENGAVIGIVYATRTADNLGLAVQSQALPPISCP